MPLIIPEKDIIWSETKDKIKIKVPVHSRVDKNVSVFTTSLYLKVSSPPWLWECFLAHSIDVNVSCVIIRDDCVSFELQKKIPEFWKKLENENKNSKIFRNERREQAFAENKKRLEHFREENAAKKQEIHSASVHKQMQLDDQERKRIEKEKRIECERIAAELEHIRKQQQKANEIAIKRKKVQEMSKNIPPTRKSGHITVTFTPRVFPTAARESKEHEEKEWLQKQTAAAISLDLDCKDLSPQERNPEWLKGKAESLFKKEDYRGAVNAFSLAIRLCPDMYSLYLGRSACHLRLRNLHKCIEDSSKALELLNPPVPSNANDRFESHKIRGAAFQQLDLPVEALMDVEAALKINPKDEELQTDAENIRKLIQSVDD